MHDASTVNNDSKQDHFAEENKYFFVWASCMVPLNTIRNVAGTVAARGYAVGFAQQRAEEAALTNQQRLFKIKLSWLS